ncbi:MAG: PIG-L family deacetylase [Bryobacterales bacterium]|nr:PIG-L family deacetylase [Bryobacterales bacterium]
MHAKVILIVAHPGEETLGCGRLLLREPENLLILHIADGITRDERALRRSGAKSAGDFVRLRRDELIAAMGVFGIAEHQLLSGGIAEREVVQNLPRAIETILQILRAVRPAEVHTHPFEGGHPDADAVCLAVHRAVETLAELDEVRPIIYEFTGYHAREGLFRSAGFLSAYPMTQISVLDEDERERKEKALRHFRSQYDLYVRFAIREERWRRAERYDFGSRPHEGDLYYELSRSGFTWDDFEKFVAKLRQEPPDSV